MKIDHHRGRHAGTTTFSISVPVLRAGPSQYRRLTAHGFINGALRERATLASRLKRMKVTLSTGVGLEAQEDEGDVIHWRGKRYGQAQAEQQAQAETKAETLLD